MSDLIRREDLVKELNAQFAVGDITREIANDILNHIPSAEPEQKKGNWIVKEEDWRKQLEWDECSECGFTTTKQYNFCPNCGADMW